MSVFEKTYLPNYQKAVEEIEKERNIQGYNFTSIYLTTLIATFKWGNLPTAKMPMFYIEKALQTAARVAFTNIKGEWAIHPAFPCGGLNDYGEFDSYTIITSNGNNYIVKAEDLEICFNNSMKIPYYPVVREFANKGSFALRSVYTSLSRAMQPPIITCENEAMMSILDSALNDNSKEFQKAILAYGEGVIGDDTKRLPLFDNRETDVIAQWDIYTRQRNLFYTTFGINNVEIQKKERLTEAEGSGNDEIVRYSLLDDMYQNRMDFIDRVKKHFNYELTLEIQRDGRTVYELTSDNKTKLDNIDIEITKGANISTKIDEGNTEEEVNNE